MRALVTGAAGFVGQWLCKALLAQGWDVTGSSLARPAASVVLGDAEAGAIDWVDGDLRDASVIHRLLDRSRPDAIFHLAAISFVPTAGGDPGVACDVNVIAAARICHEIARRREAGASDPVVLIVGSAEQYGRADRRQLPLTEDTPQRPLTVYGATKTAQEILALQSWRAHGVRVICTRSFSHSGVGQDPQFLLPGLVRRALALRGRPSSELAIGNLTPVRDYLHVADVVDAYLRLASAGEAGEVYNVASGCPVSVSELVALVLRRTGVDARLVEDAALARPIDVPALVGDATKLRRATGWSPARSCDDIVQDLIDAATH